MTQRDALEAAEHEFRECGGMSLRDALAHTIRAYLAALTPGDEAGLVKRLRKLRLDLGIDLGDLAADALEAKDAELARLQGEVGEAIAALGPFARWLEAIERQREKHGDGPPWAAAFPEHRVANYPHVSALMIAKRIVNRALPESAPKAPESGL